MKHIFTILIIIFFNIIHINAQNNWLEEGRTAFKNSDYNTAINAFENHLQLIPQEKEAIISLAQSYQYTNKLEKAAYWYNEAMALNVSAENIFQYGKTLMLMGKYKEAKEQFSVYATVNSTIGDQYVEMCDYAHSKKDMEPLFRVNKDVISSTQADFSPTFYNNQLIYASSRKDILRTDATEGPTAGIANGFNHIFHCNIDENTTSLSAPKYLRTWAIDKKNLNQSPLSFSQNGQWVAFVTNSYINGNSQLLHDSKTDIYIAQINENGDWINPQIFPHNGDFSNHYPYLSDDGNTLYFASDKNGGLGGFDLYRSEKTNGIWTSPLNLGSEINSLGNEISPYLDEKDLYFSSDFHIGMGGYDVFRANVINNKWTVQNMGTGINSSANDWSFIYNKNKNLGFMVSDKEAIENLYRLARVADDFNLYIKDAYSGMAIPNASIDFSQCGLASYKSNIQGRFGFKTSTEITCDITISKDGYDDFVFELSPQLVATGQLEINLIQKGDKYQGKVVDGFSNVPLKNVLVQIFCETDGSKFEVFTNDKGIYSIPMKEFSKYMISFSKAAYSNMNIKVDTKDGSDKSVLGSLLLYPNTKPITDQPINDQPIIDKPIVDGNTQPNTPTTVQNGFAVQLMSLSIKNNNEPKDLDKVKSDNHQLYTTSDNKWRRYRIGTFKTREEAKAIQTWARANGFPKAYIVEEDTIGKIQVIN